MDEHTVSPGPLFMGPVALVSGRANARLVAEAPALLEALRPFAAFACGKPGDGCSCNNCRARDVIIRATGDTPKRKGSRRRGMV